MNAMTHRPAISRMFRIALGLMLALTLLPSALGLGTPVHAAGPARETREPMARIQLVVKSIRILDDNDYGEGEMHLYMELICFAAPAPCLGDTSASLDSYGKEFDASDSETVTLNVTMPQSNETLNPLYLGDAAVDVGYPVYAGHRYEFRIFMEEEDIFTQWDKMGDVTVRISQANNWGIGTHTVRSTIGTSPGDYEITFQILPTPLPELQPVAIEVTRPADSTDELVCTSVMNRGPLDAGPFQVSLYLNSVSPAIGTVETAGLGARQSAQLCLRTDLPNTGLHQLSAVVDEGHRIPEQSEINNRLDKAYDPRGIGPIHPTGPGVAVDPGQGSPLPPPIIEGPMPNNGSPRPAPSPAPIVPKPGTVSGRGVDLQVGSVDVKARDGGDCVVRGVRNVVTVMVKNAGDKPADEFAVELRVGNDRRGQRTVTGLAAGAEAPVVFQSVGMAKDEHAIKVVVDPDHAVTEDDDTNNSKTIEVDCSPR